MLLPICCLLLVVVGKFLFLLLHPLGMTVMELFQALVIESCFDWCLLRLDECHVKWKIGDIILYFIVGL